MGGKKVDEKVDEKIDTPVEKPKEAPKPASSSDDNIFGALCYIIGIIVPLFILFTEKKQNKFLAFHAWQSLIFCIAWFAIFSVGGILVTVISIVTMGIGGLLSCLFLPVGLVALCAILFVDRKSVV